MHHTLPLADRKLKRLVPFKSADDFSDVPDLKPLSYLRWDKKKETAKRVNA